MENGKLPAFGQDGNSSGHPETIGLTKREYFAGLAMQALVPAWVENRADDEQTAKQAVKFADALLKELEL